MNIKPATSEKSAIGALHTKEKAKRVLKGIPPVKIVVKRVYAEGKPMGKAFSDYLSEQIATKVR